MPVKPLHFDSFENVVMVTKILSKILFNKSTVLKRI